MAAWAVVAAAPAAGPGATTSIRGTDEAIRLSGSHANRRAGSSIAISGSYAVAGVPYDATDAGDDAGTARVIVQDGTTWMEDAVLEAPGGGSQDRFGWSVAIDGDTLAVGAPFDGGGAVHIFGLTGGAWQHMATLHGNGTDGDRFGYSLAMEGGLLLVGSPYGLDGPAECGVVHVFERQADVWTEVDVLAPWGAEDGQRFGHAVALQGDSVFVSAPFADFAAVDGGAVAVFGRQNGVWDQVDYLWAPDAGYGTSLGWSLDVEGDRLIAGGPGDNTIATRAGCAHVFVHDGVEWTHEARLDAADAERFDAAGFSVAIEGDIALVGVSGDDHRGWQSGSVTVFRKYGTIWKELSRLLADDGYYYDRFAGAMAMDGTAIIGAPNRNGSQQDLGGLYAVSSLRTVNWLSPAGGPLAGDANWWPKPPDSSDTVLFSLLAPVVYPLELDGNLDVAASRIELDRVNLEIVGDSGRLGRVGDGSLVVSGRSTLRTASLALGGGYLEIPGDVVLSQGGGSGTIEIKESRMQVGGTWRQGKGGALVLTLREDGAPSLILEEPAEFGGTLIIETPVGLEVNIGDVFELIGGPGTSTQSRFNAAVMPGIGNGLYLHLYYGTGLTGTGGVHVIAQPFANLLGFDDPDSVPLDSQPVGVAVADLTGSNSGTWDILVAVDGEPGSLYALINDGSGGFDPGSIVIYPLGNRPSGIDTGDFDNDGAIDVAVVNNGDDTVQAFLNMGDGTGTLFDAALVETPLEPMDVEIIDINDDGRGDLVVSCSGSGTLEFYYSNDTRGLGFPPGGSVDVGEGSDSLDPGDVGDTKDLDIIVTNPENGRGTVLVKGGLGTPAAPGGSGDAPFVIISQVTIGTNPGDVEIADLDNDGDGDMVVVCPNDDMISIFLSDGSGVVWTRLTIPVGDAPSDLVVLDFDGDADRDIAVIAGDDEGNRQVQLLRNDLDLYNGEMLVFAAPEPLDAGFNPVLVDAGHIDGDIFSDLVVISAEAAGLRGAFPGAVDTLINDLDKKPLCAADLDGSGAVDVPDLLQVIGAWGATGVPQDLDGDGVVGVGDLLQVIAAWGPCP